LVLLNFTPYRVIELVAIANELVAIAIELVAIANELVAIAKLYFVFLAGLLDTCFILKDFSCPPLPK
jgi:hypothetical protein